MRRSTRLSSVGDTGMRAPSDVSCVFAGELRRGIGAMVMVRRRMPDGLGRGPGAGDDPRCRGRGDGCHVLDTHCVEFVFVVAVVCCGTGGGLVADLRRYGGEPARASVTFSKDAHRTPYYSLARH